MRKFRLAPATPIVGSLILLLLLLPFVTQTYGRSLNSHQNVRGSGLEDRSIAMFNTMLLAADNDYTCDADKPCSNSACCGKSGNCGYGPDYCGDGCQSNCDAHAECGEFAEEPDKECPLKVCCSQYGFCGTTEEFCNEKCQSNCGTPEVPSGGSSKSVRSRVIGYYESWAPRRPCKKFAPADIPVSGLTHINFAFAYIQPETYEVVPMDSQTPAKLFQEVTELKSRSSASDLEVFIAIGGWTFSDNGTATQPLFGEIAADQDKRQQFADNLVTFMTKYGFDGVDLDWEYPGAPDRGGTEDDGKNFVSLMKTLRETFNNSPRGGYGLTFTIPSSYWYLQYFDLPGLLEYADWTNMMSYDLHGVWDANNEIGNIIHGHTNLTEIKLAAELLWRNDIPPGKVVLGTGFYGRSFQLSDTRCSEPGCQFKGPAQAGECTGEGGILGYFEIQDILADDNSIEPIHDEESAVNYFTFGSDQWVSYDDRKTFQKKVDWADDVGLGGLMIWAVDMDDDSYTALSGLLGKDVGDSIDLDSGAGQIGLVIDDWGSQNGQFCVMEDCGKQCDPYMTEVGRANDECDDNEHRKICCPSSNVPSNCQWRGGDKGLTCSGQCRPGELGLFRSEYGDKECLYGEQEFCCTSDDYEDLVGSCETTDCGVTDCPSGKYAITTFRDYGGECEGPSPDKLRRSVCCDEGGKLDECRWTKCHNYQCNTDEVLVKKTQLSNIFCRGDDESRLCCKVTDPSAFLPVAPDKIFPELPPDDYDYQVEDEALSTYDAVHTAPESFGLLVLSGPPGVVSNLDRRDGSHITFLSCDRIDEQGMQTTRIVCMQDGMGSNCDDVMLDGVEGTIVKMPRDCGPGQYAVVRSLEISRNQSIPSHIRQKRESSRPVMDLAFDYDFERIKRADEKVYVRIDYANVFNYLHDIVLADPVQKRSVDRDFTPRFYSPKVEEWETRYAELTEVSGSDLYYTEMSRTVDQLLFGSSKQCDSSSQFLKLDVEGEVASRAKYGFSLVGTLDPWNIQESYGFIGASFDIDLDVSCQANTGMDITRVIKELWQTPLRYQRFYQPGLVSIAPQFRVFAGIEAADVGIVGDFTANLRGGTEDYLWTYFPEAAGGRKGQTKSKTNSNAFDGKYKVTQGSLTLTFEPRVDLDIQLGKYIETSDGYASTKKTKRGWEADTNLASTELSTWMVMGLKMDAYKALYEQSEGYSQAMNYGGTHDLFPDDDESQYLIGDRPKAIQLAGPTRDLNGPDKPDFSGYPIFGGFELLKCVDGLDDDAGDIEEAVCVANIASADPSLIEDGEEPSIPGSELGSNVENKSLDVRGNPRPYNVVDVTGQVLFTIYCLAYPSIGRLPWSTGDPRMDIGNPSGCTEVAVTDDGDPNMNYVTEHIFELQSIAQFLSFAIHGQLPNGQLTARSTITQRIAEQLQRDYTSWAGGNAPAGNALDHMFNSIGSNDNKGAMIPCEEQLNAVKGRLWKGSNIIADDTWDDEDLDETDNIHMALSWLRDAGNIFAYMEADPVQDRFQETIDSIRDELEQFQDLYNANQSNQIDILGLWDEWIIAYFEDMRDRAAAWVRRRGATIESNWEDIVRSARRDYNGDPNPENQITLEAAEQNLKVIKETVENILSRITNTSFWRWLT